MQELREHVKHWTQSILNRIGYRITKVDTVDLFQPLLFYLRQKTRDFFFVQIGAFDGIMFDPIYDFVLQHHNRLRGIVIEPMREAFQELRENYRKYPNIITVNAAIHNYKEEMLLYKVDPSKLKYLPNWAKTVASFNKDHHKSFDIPSDYIIGELVKCITFDTLLDSYDVKKIDLLQIDTEGYDSEIIRSLDFTRISPAIIHFEHGLPHGTMSLEEHEGMLGLLHDNGYEAFVGNYDTTAYHRHLHVDLQEHGRSHKEAFV